MSDPLKLFTIDVFTDGFETDELVYMTPYDKKIQKMQNRITRNNIR